ncbi:hypothetical protein [Mycobacterium conspicuum]|uniref:hypothetical protein n=1 Tax=Mycobacterium conspicuum TaxID=44010 RepID=UPI000A14856A|nr:hypothetical protein [Mycobacterium conspicuum]ORV42178.1 hypothetical protein AWC00_11660 [Mycobacterium conspicuum]
MARRAGAGLAVVGTALVLPACGSMGTPASSSSSADVVTTVAGGDTCQRRVGPNDGTPDFYRQQYADGLADPLEARLQTYGSATASGDPHRIGDVAAALDTDIRADARLVNVPRLYGCYDQAVLTRLQDATEAFATTLDALSCAAADMCNRRQAEVPGLVARAAPQERSYVEALDAYAAQFGGEQLPVPGAAAGSKVRRV